jgi:uncharacterized protein (TIGR00661 family)
VFARGWGENKVLFREYLEPFEPDVVLSDFEPFTAWWAWRRKVPFISTDHEHLLTFCELEKVSGGFLSRLNSEVVTRCYYFGAERYLVPNFFRAPVTHKRAVLVPPVLREDVLKYEPCEGQHIVFYSTDRSSKSKWVERFARFADVRVFIYGFDVDEEKGNCVFRRTSTEGFLRDLASCRAVIATAGFTLISECMHYRKKMLLVPIPGQYEQMLNAHYVEKLGLGLKAEEVSGEKISEFLELAEEPGADDERILWPDNTGMFRAVDEEIEQLL